MAGPQEKDSQPLEAEPRAGKWNNRGKGELLSQAQERVLLYGCEPLSIPSTAAVFFIIPKL